MLTVVVLSYNHETTIARALDSVLEQDTTYPVEIWICEDASTDGTLALCRAYAEQYSGRVRLIAQPQNSKGKHFQAALSRIESKYFAVLDGDDYWCDKKKVQTGLDTLEANPGYATFAHDTLYVDDSGNSRRSLVHEVHNVVISNPVDINDAPYLHTSSRIHKNVIDFSKYDLEMLYDIYLFYMFLDYGSLYYHDEVMSVYSITGSGMWSGLNKSQQAVNTAKSYATTNCLLEYRYDALMSQKVPYPGVLATLKLLLGRSAGWAVYIGLVRLRQILRW